MNDSMNLPSPSGSNELERGRTTFENSSPEISPNREVMYESPSMEDHMVNVNFADMHLKNQPESTEISPKTDEHISPYVSMESFASVAQAQ